MCWGQGLAQLPRAVLEPPSLKGFKSHVNVALGDMAQVALAPGHRLDLIILEMFSNLEKIALNCRTLGSL